MKKLEQTRTKTNLWLWTITTALMLSLMLGFFVSARPASADTSSDATKALGSQGWYISDAAAKSIGGNTSDAQNTLKNAINDLKNRKHPTVIAVLDSNTLPAQCNNQTMSACAESLVKNFAGQGIENAIVVDVPNQKGGLFSKSLTDADTKQITSSLGSPFQGNVVTNLVTMANKTADRIDSNNKAASDAAKNIANQQKQADSNAFVTTLIIIAVVILVVIGAFAFLIFTTKNIWRKKVETLEKSANEVSDLVYNLSDEVEYLPDNTREQAKATFSQGAMQVNQANDAARQIKGASTMALVFKWGQYNNKYQEALSKMDSVRSTLEGVNRTVQKDINQNMNELGR